MELLGAAKGHPAMLEEKRQEVCSRDLNSNSPPKVPRRPPDEGGDHMDAEREANPLLYRQRSRHQNC